VGFLLARGGAERGGIDGADALGEDAKAALAEDLARSAQSRGPESAR
jgi:hypothetical protein